MMTAAIILGCVSCVFSLFSFFWIVFRQIFRGDGEGILVTYKDLFSSNMQFRTQLSELDARIRVLEVSSSACLDYNELIQEIKDDIITLGEDLYSLKSNLKKTRDKD